MPDNEVVVTMSAQDASMVAAWQRGRASVQGFESELAKVARSGKKAGDDVTSSFKGFGSAVAGLASGLTGIAGGIGGIVTVAQLFRQEYDMILQRQSDAAANQVSLADIQRRAFDALKGGNLKPEKLMEMVAGRSKVPFAESFGSIEAALKEAGGDFSHAAAAEAGLAAGEFAPHLPASDRNHIAAAAVALQKGNKDLTTGQAISQILALARKSESGTGELAKSMIPAIGIGRGISPGSSTGDLAALFLAIESQQDAGIGAASSTGQKLLQQLATGKTKGMGLDAALTKASGDKATRDAILKKFGKDPAGQLAVSQLLTPGSATAQTYFELQAELRGSPAEVEQRERQRMAGLNRAPGQDVAAIERAGKVAEQRSMDAGEALTGQLRKTYSEALTRMGYWMPSRAMEDYSLHSELTGRPADEQKQIVKGKLREKAGTLAVTGHYPGSLMRRDDIYANPEQRQSALEMLAKLDELVGLIKEQNVIVADLPNQPQKIRVDGQPAGPQRPLARALNDR